MSRTTTSNPPVPGPNVNVDAVAQRLRRQAERFDLIRRGVCLINAGRYRQAEEMFQNALRIGEPDSSAAAYLAACLLGRGEPEAAADQFDRIVADDPSATTARIRHALSLWSANKCDEAIQSLRDGIRQNRECAELHFQLGTLLAAREEYEEAELRLTQALNIDPEHTAALINLALCCAVRHAPGDALMYLRRAQARNPHDARIGLLLSQTARAIEQQGLSVRVRAHMPDATSPSERRDIDELSRQIERDPEFVDAFLALPRDRVDRRVYTLLLETLRAALARRPAHSELHYLCGRVLDRLDRPEDAIKENERAVEIEPKFVRALIELARLYHKTERTADAKTRLQRAIAAGGDYADVYYLLGNIYRDEGNVTEARSAYRHALLLNDRYEAALKALEALPV